MADLHSVQWWGSLSAASILHVNCEAPLSEYYPFVQTSKVTFSVTVRVFMGKQRYSWQSPPLVNVTVEVKAQSFAHRHPHLAAHIRRASVLMPRAVTWQSHIPSLCAL